ncbi:helix-turn-helix domain-containing protein [Streptomyces aureus]
MTAPRTLTARQRQVLLLVANGHTNAQIGARLNLHPRTVDRHLAETYKRLGARDRAHAVAISLIRRELDARQIFVPDQQQEHAA